MTVATARFAIHALDPHRADELRAAADVVLVADSQPGWPCRQCLRDVAVGDEVVLVSYDPFDPASTSPYRAPGPIFLHRRPCVTADPSAEPPEQLTSRLLSVRAYDAADRMRDGRVVAGTELRGLLDDLFADGDVTSVHVHNAGPGCFAARVTRVI